MNNETPRPKYYHTINKLRCKVCRARLVKPRPLDKNKPLTVYHMLYNRGLCGASCLFTDYEDLDRLTEDLYDALDSVQGDLADCLASNKEGVDIWKP